MSNGLLVRLVRFGDAAITVSSADADFPKAALGDEQPRVVYRSDELALPATVTITVDLGADTPIGAVGALFTNLSAEATWEVRGATAAQGTGHLADAGSRLFGLGGAVDARIEPASSTTRFHALLHGDAASCRYVRVTINETAANLDEFVEIGVLAIGTNWTPHWNFEWGGGRKVIDLSERHDMPGGALAFWRKARVPVARVTFGDLKPDELAALHTLLLDLGESEPLLFVEDPGAATGRHEGLHYGVLEGLDFFERKQTDKSKFELTIRQWL